MALVGYSDSEGSDAEAAGGAEVPVKEKSTQPPTKPKSSFQKVVDREKPGKIRVSLPDTKPTNGDEVEGGVADGPPAKKARTAGGFNSLLPAPKALSKPGATKNGAEGDSGSKEGKLSTGSRRSFKTSATPAFSRVTDQEMQEHGDREEFPAAREPLQSAKEEVPPGRGDDATELQPELKLVGRPTMFKPLSVSRNGPKKKRKTVSNIPDQAATSTKLLDSVGRTDIPPSEPLKTVAKAKQSLFSNYDEESVPSEPAIIANTELTPPHSNYEIPPTMTELYDEQAETGRATTNTSSTQPENLESLAHQLNLSEAERRQLFGRKGKPTEAQITQFSLAAEYARNNEMLQNNETAPAHNPVRSIQPGKHSLQQLLNAAANQKDALEESFASGRRNKKDAGNRYGWG